MPEWIKDHPQYEVISAALRSESLRQQQWAKEVLGQLDTQQTEYAAEHDDLCWYFLTFCCCYRWGFNKEYTAKFGRLTPKLVAEQLGLTKKPRPYKCISVSFPSRTMWACIDIDTVGKYHPQNNPKGVDRIKDAMADIGLVEALEFQSSFSTGIHLYYPLPTAVKTWDLACSLAHACRAKKLDVSGGNLELRPNTRNFKSGYLTIRSPFSGQDNGLFLPGIGGIEHSDLSVLRHMFNSAAIKNSLALPEDYLSTIAGLFTIVRAPLANKNSLDYYKTVLSDGFTSSSQTQEIQFAALIVARMVEGVDTVPALRARLIELVTSSPGYAEYCQHQRQIENGTYWTDKTLRQQLTFEPADYEKSSWKIHNDKKAKTASEQALQAISRAIDDGQVYSSQNAALQALRAKYDAPCRRWWLKPDYAKYKKMLDPIIRRKNSK
tara:strand:+ start:75 stop:1382 length:1308 start_codon:yes stop_codon:yes gene_type:complete